MMAVCICMSLLILSASKFVSDKIGRSFETNSEVFTQFFSSTISTGTRLKRGAMIEPQIATALATEGLSIDVVRVVHSDGTVVSTQFGEGVNASRADDLPVADAMQAASSVAIGADLLVRTPIILGTGEEALVVGELAILWNRGVVDAQIQQFQIRFASEALIAAIALAAATGVVLVILAVRPLRTLNRALRDVTEDKNEIELPRSRSTEVSEINASMEVLQQRSQERATVLVGLTETVSRARLGDFSYRLGEQNDVCAKLDQLMAEIEHGLSSTNAVLARMANGDLAARMEGQFQGEFAKLQSHLNGTGEALSAAIVSIATSANEVDNTASTLSDSITDLSTRTQNGAASLEESTAAITNIADGLKASEGATNEAQARAKEAIERAASGEQIVGQAMTRMGDIAKHSDEIGQIISMIDDVAFQTNLLALNAGVEAARAGESGRGFAVVAQEVRALAQRASQSAADIKALITKSSAEVQAGVGMVEKAGEAIREIVDVIGALSESVTEVAEHTAGQSLSIVEVSQAIQSLDLDTQRNANMVVEAASMSEAMLENANLVISSTQQFKLAQVSKGESLSTAA